MPGYDDDELLPSLGDMFAAGVMRPTPGPPADVTGIIQPFFPSGFMPPTRGLRPGTRTTEEVADPTNTGWTFRDYKPIHRQMAPGDWRRVEQTPSQDVELPIRSMFAGQKTVNPDFTSVLDRPVYGPDNPKRAPYVIKKGGQYYVQDGHHRLTAISQMGRQTAGVRMVDLDEPPDSTQLDLLDMLRGLK